MGAPTDYHWSYVTAQWMGDYVHIKVLHNFMCCIITCIAGLSKFVMSLCVIFLTCRQHVLSTLEVSCNFLSDLITCMTSPMKKCDKFTCNFSGLANSMLARWWCDRMIEGLDFGRWRGCSFEPLFKQQLYISPSLSPASPPLPALTLPPPPRLWLVSWLPGPSDWMKIGSPTCSRRLQTKDL